MFRSLYPAGAAPQLSDIWHLGTRGAIDVAYDEALRLHDRARAAGDSATEGAAALQAAWFCFQMGRIEPGLEHATAAKDLYRTLDSTLGEAAAGAMGAWLLLEAGLTEEASTEADQALVLLDMASDPDIVGFATNVLGVVLWFCRQLDGAIALCEEAIGLAERARDPVATAWWRINLAGAHAEVGIGALDTNRTAEGEAALATAVRINAEALAGAAATGDLWCQHLALCNAVEYLCAARRLDEAAACLARCEALRHQGTGRSQIHYLFTKAQMLLCAGRHAEALAPCEAALALATAAGDIEARIQSLKHLSAIHEELGAHKDALIHFKQFFAAHQTLTADKAQRLARLAGTRHETGKLRRKVEAAEAQVASLEVTSRSDPLTGLANRRAFDHALAGLTNRPDGYAIAIIDLDRFKAINDCFSHMVGDAVLKQVGAILSAGCPPGALVARLGGEEFALVCATGHIGAAAHLCESLRREIAAYPWQRHHPGLAVTASIGLAGQAEGAVPADVMAVADRRLYQAKTLGRNRVVGVPQTAEGVAVSRRGQGLAAAH